MQINYFGKGQKKIIIVHGWIHSYKRYIKLAEDLSSVATIELVKLPGFGNTKCDVKENITSYYVEEFIKLLDKNEYDLIIGHSLGANVILRALESCSVRSKILLLNPSYYGIDHLKFIARFEKFNTMFFNLQSKLPRFICKPFIKVLGLTSINKYSLVDDMLVDDVRSAQPDVAALLLKEIAFDTWRASKNIESDITVVVSKKDRLISQKNNEILVKDLENFKLITFEKSGHTCIVENYDDVLEIVLELLEIRK